jgi:hypothetical protein
MAIVDILSKTEIKKYDYPPVFDRNERTEAFKPNSAATKFMASIRLPENKVGFLLQYQCH